MEEDFFVILVALIVVALISGCSAQVQPEAPVAHMATLVEDVSILSHSNRPYQLQKGLSVAIFQCFDDGYATVYFPYPIDLPNNLKTEGYDSGIIKQSQLSQGACDW